MKISYILVLMALVLGLNANAQKFSVESMKMELDPSITDGDRNYDNLLKWAEETKAHPKTSNDPKMWYYRGLTYLKISTLNNDLSKAHPDAVKIALESFNNAIKTDVKNKVTKDAKANLLNVAIGLYNSGYNAYNAEDYKAAYSDFEMAVPLMVYDTDGLLKRNNLTVEVLEQMMAFSAMNGGEDEKAKSALQTLIDKGSVESSIYSNMARLQLKGGDTTAALSTIESGKEVNEADKTLINMELDLYLKQGKSEELIQKLNTAIEDDPGNTVYYFARAISYEGMDRMDEAAADYDKILEIDPDYYDASFNKGVMYLNKVTKIVDKLRDEYKPSVIEREEAKIMVLYGKAIKEFEHVFENNDEQSIEDKVELAKTMKRIYSRLERQDEYDKMKSFVQDNE